MTFEEFADVRLAAIRRFAGVLTGDHALAEDMVQEVLVRALSRWRKIGALDHPESYIRKMVVNEYLSWRRRNWRLVFTAAHLEVPGPDHASGHAERDALLGEIGKLPRRQRAVLVLRYYEGLSDQEIADTLGCATVTVRGYASRALATLRIELRAPSFPAEGNR